MHSLLGVYEFYEFISEKTFFYRKFAGAISRRGCAGFAFCWYNAWLG